MIQSGVQISSVAIYCKTCWDPTSTSLVKQDKISSTPHSLVKTEAAVMIHWHALPLHAAALWAAYLLSRLFQTEVTAFPRRLLHPAVVRPGPHATAQAAAALGTRQTVLRHTSSWPLS